MKKYLKIWISIGVILSILFIFRLFFPYIIFTEIQPNKEEYMYGENIIFAITEVNPYPFPYKKIYSSTCTKLDIYGSYRPIYWTNISFETCGMALTEVNIAPFWSRTYEVKKTLVPYKQKYNKHIWWNNIIYVWPWVNKLSIWKEFKFLKMASAQGINIIANDCSIYSDESSKNGCIEENPKKIEDCKMIFKETWEDSNLQECIKKISNS